MLTTSDYLNIFQTLFPNTAVLVFTFKVLAAFKAHGVEPADVNGLRSSIHDQFAHAQTDSGGEFEACAAEACREEISLRTCCANNGALIGSQTVTPDMRGMQ